MITIEYQVSRVNLVRAAAVISIFVSAVSAQTLGNCPVFPAGNVWNTPVDRLPLDPNSGAYVQAIGASKKAHADFGSGTYAGAPIGIPFTTVTAAQASVDVAFTYRDESDPGPYPIPPDAPIEGGPGSTGDRHVLIVDTSACKLYELYNSFPQTDGTWKADSGAIFDLYSNGLRPAGWTSADAAGLPILPGLARYDEAASGAITHALRFTAPHTRKAYVWPARHYASSIVDPEVPPMGQRFRLRADFDLTPFAPEVRVILQALKKYGMILADNGSSWFVSGAPDPRWDNAHLAQFSQLAGTDFEAIDETGLTVDQDSGQAGAQYRSTQAHTISNLFASQWRNGGKGFTDPIGDTLLLSGFTRGQPGISARGLLKFEGLTAPAGKRVQSAALIVQFIGSVDAPTIAGYYLTKSWGDAVSWSNASETVKWSEPGANGLGTDHTTGQAFTLADLHGSGEQRGVIALDPSVVQSWIDDPASNRGLLLINESESAVRIQPRPILTITFN